MINAAIACISLLLGFAIFLLCARGVAGFTSQNRFKWHPSAKLASFLFLGQSRIAALAVLFFSAVAFAVACLTTGIPAVIAIGLFWFSLAPLPYHILDVVRKDMSLKSKEIIFRNVFNPFSTRHERILKDGKIVEERAQICFFLDAESWKRIKVASADDQRYLNQFHLSGGLYVAPATNENLQLFDSLGLYEFILHPDNGRAIHAFEEALRYYFGEPFPVGSRKKMVLPPPRNQGMTSMSAGMAPVTPPTRTFVPPVPVVPSTPSARTTPSTSAHSAPDFDDSAPVGGSSNFSDEDEDPFRGGGSSSEDDFDPFHGAHADSDSSPEEPAYIPPVEDSSDADQPEPSEPEPEPEPEPTIEEEPRKSISDIVETGSMIGHNSAPPKHNKQIKRGAKGGARKVSTQSTLDLPKL